MAHLAYHPTSSTLQRKKVERTAKWSRKIGITSTRGFLPGRLLRVAAMADAKAVRAMHDTIIERAATSYDVSNMTHFDASMTEVEVIAKFMGISLEEAAKL